MFLHRSLENETCRKDRKLGLLVRRVITPAQFLQLLEPDDPYTMIGPTLVAKGSEDQFIKEWQARRPAESRLPEPADFTVDEFVNRLQEIVEHVPAAAEDAVELREKLADAKCPVCTRNRILLRIAKKARETATADSPELIKRLVAAYFPFESSDGLVPSEIHDWTDGQWLDPDRLKGLGYDLISDLSSCFECSKKHLSRAKALYEELCLGYPDHKSMAFSEMSKAGQAVEEAFIIWWDALGQLDMSACELVGNLVDLPRETRCQMIELAAKIRAQRLAFQEDISAMPDWDGLRLEIQRLQNRLSGK